MEWSLKTRLTDQDTMVEDVITLKKHFEENARETATLRDALTINAETIDSQYCKIQKIEQELAEKDEKMIVRNNNEGMEKHDIYLEKNTMLQASFLEKLSDSVKAKTAKLVDLQKEIIQSKDLMVENSVLRNQNECIKKKRHHKFNKNH